MFTEGKSTVGFVPMQNVDEECFVSVESAAAKPIAFTASLYVVT